MLHFLHFLSNYSIMCYRFQNRQTRRGVVDRACRTPWGKYLYLKSIISDNFILWKRIIDLWKYWSVNQCIIYKYRCIYTMHIVKRINNTTPGRIYWRRWWKVKIILSLRTRPSIAYFKHYTGLFYFHILKSLNCVCFWYNSVIYCEQIFIFHYCCW